MKKLNFKRVLGLMVMVMGFAMSGNAQSTVLDWTGCKIANAGATDSTPAYLYNPATKTFFINGGNWGTQCTSNADYGLPIKAFKEQSDGTYRIETALETNEGTHIALVYRAASNTMDRGFFCDRTTTSTEQTKFSLVATGSGNGYYITAEITSSGYNIPVGTYYFTAHGDGQAITYETTPSANSEWLIINNDEYYAHVTANPANLRNPTNITFAIKDANFDRGHTQETSWVANLSSEGASTSYTRVGRLEEDASYVMESDYTPRNYVLVGSTKTQTQNNATVFVVKNVTNNTCQLTRDNNGTTQYLASNLSWTNTATTWNYVMNGTTADPTFTFNIGTTYIRYQSNAFAGSSSTGTASRRDIRVHKVVTSPLNADGQPILMIGTEQNYKTAFDNREPLNDDSHSEFHSGEGKKGYTDRSVCLRNQGKLFGVQVRETNGTVSQTFKLHHTGWYVLSCQGFYYNPSADANNVASLFITAPGVDNTNKTTRQYLINAPYENVPLLTGTGAWDDAEEKFFQKTIYKNSIMVFISMGTDSNGDFIMADDVNGKDVTIGIEWQNALAGDWTAFDDFQLEFLGYNNELILREDNLDHNYLHHSKEEYVNSTLRLNRTFTEGKWNSLVLPVALNVGQFRTAFGNGARAAELTKVQDGVLHFETIAKNGKRDDAEYLKANTPYIVYIDKNPAETEHYEVYLKATDEYAASYPNGMIQKEIGGDDCPYYIIPFVTLNKSDLDVSNAEKEAVNKNGVVNNKYTVFDEDDAAKFVTFSGIYEMTYTPNNEGTGTLRHGYPDMIGSVVFKGGELWHIQSDYGMKAYRAFLEAPMFLEPEEGEGGAGSKLGLAIDGEEVDATYIHAIFGGNTTIAPTAKAGVYTINGQLINTTGSTAGLAKGIYVINGKKCVVK